MTKEDLHKAHESELKEVQSALYRLENRQKELSVILQTLNALTLNSIQAETQTETQAGAGK